MFVQLLFRNLKSVHEVLLLASASASNNRPEPGSATFTRG